MNQVAVFNFETFQVRTVVEGDTILFVGKDVADALGYTDTVNALKQHCKGVAKHHPLSTAGGTQDVRVLTEPDLYRLIFGSMLPSAQKFEAWVFEEVLPAIRKTGRYETPEHYLQQEKADAERLEFEDDVVAEVCGLSEVRVRKEASRLYDECVLGISKIPDHSGQLTNFKFERAAALSVVARIDPKAVGHMLGHIDSVAAESRRMRDTQKRLPEKSELPLGQYLRMRISARAAQIHASMLAPIHEGLFQRVQVYKHQGANARELEEYIERYTPLTPI